MQLPPMLRSLLLAAVLVAAAAAPATSVAQAPVQAVHAPADLPWQTLEAAVTSAAKSDRKIMLSIYAPWCGFCRKQNLEVFPEKAVHGFLKEHFELARLNGDDTETIQRFRGHILNGTQLAQGFGVTGYPTVVFLDADGGYITRLPGFADAETFLDVLRYIATDAYKETPFEEFLKTSE